MKNNDDVPELYCNGTYSAAGNPILYIQNGEVKEYNGDVLYGDFYYVERGGYIYYFEGRMGNDTDTIAYLDENNELTILAKAVSNIGEGSEYYYINGEEVAQSV